MRVITVVGLVLLGLAVLTQSVFAAPALSITKPPVQPADLGTGPVNDPYAAQGQWFAPYGSEVGAEVSPYEFHDNVYNYGGSLVNDQNLQSGGFGSYKAIYGKVTSISYNGANIASFTIKAQITNDTPYGNGTWYRGENSHGEWTTQGPYDAQDSNDPIDHPVTDTTGAYVGDFHNTKLTAEFALTSLVAVPSTWTSPYTQGQQPFIVATNADTSAWYCWTSGGQTPTGNFSVPTWDFGDIAVGQYAQRDLVFSVADGGLSSADPRYINLVNSLQAAWGSGDVFFNRTTDLKIGDWLDGLDATDAGTAYPTDPTKGGNVSVFFTPEPGTFALLGIAAVALLACVRCARRQA